MLAGKAREISPGRFVAIATSRNRTIQAGALIDQLAVGGIMVIPLEDRPGKQDLYRITKTEDGYETEHLLPVRFVPLVEGKLP